MGRHLCFVFLFFGYIALKGPGIHLEVKPLMSKKKHDHSALNQSFKKFESDRADKIPQIMTSQRLGCKKTQPLSIKPFLQEVQILRGDNKIHQSVTPRRFSKIVAPTAHYVFKLPA